MVIFNVAFLYLSYLNVRKLHCVRLISMSTTICVMIVFWAYFPWSKCLQKIIHFYCILADITTYFWLDLSLANLKHYWKITNTTYFVKHVLKWELLLLEPHLIVSDMKERNEEFLSVCDLCLMFLPNEEINNVHMPNSLSFIRPFNVMNTWRERGGGRTKLIFI